jgi:3',5'-cyclic AMP phosphodiesterase CpdA
MSDTHSKNIDLPKGDVLIHAGDFSNVGERTDILNFIEWLNRQPFEHKVIVAGNHEIGLDV